jgi:hypothetical protein
MMHPGDSFARIRPEHIKRYGRLLDGLNKLMREIREYEPKANIYVEDQGHFNLMVGDSHADHAVSGRDRAQHENVAVEVTVPFSGGGGW